MNKIKKYIEKDFGVGGIGNYSQSTALDIIQLLGIFYGDNFGDTERASILEFLNRNEGNWQKPKYNHFNREKINDLSDEASELKEMWDL